jgi:hypothetical protein
MSGKATAMARPLTIRRGVIKSKVVIRTEVVRKRLNKLDECLAILPLQSEQWSKTTF